jgi:hypothetical protein
LVVLQIIKGHEFNLLSYSRLVTCNC